MKSTLCIYKTFLNILLSLLFISSCAHAYESSEKAVYKVTAVYPHDRNSQTEGLIYHDKILYEGTGPCLDGPSSIRKIDLETGKILKYMSLTPPIFGEGITIYRGMVIQLTYKLKTGYVYSLKTFRRKKVFKYDTEGWGLTHDGEHLIMSDGSPALRFLDPKTFTVVKKINVHNDRKNIHQINELEFINGKIYANVFLTDQILIISPDTGEVLETIYLTDILKGYYRPGYNDPANGIAYDAENNSILITGKYWPNIYRISLPEKECNLK